MTMFDWEEEFHRVEGVAYSRDGEYGCRDMKLVVDVEIEDVDVRDRG